MEKLSIEPKRTFEFGTPMFYSHSRDDKICPVSHGRDLRTTASQLGYDVTYNEYEEGGHWIVPGQGVDDVAAFIKKCM